MNQLPKIILCSEAVFTELKYPLLENGVQEDKVDLVQSLVLRMEKGLDLEYGKSDPDKRKICVKNLRQMLLLGICKKGQQGLQRESKL